MLAFKVNSQKSLYLYRKLRFNRFIVMDRACDVGSISIASAKDLGLLGKSSALKAINTLRSEEFLAPMGEQSKREFARRDYFEPTEKGRELILKINGGIRRIPVTVKENESIVGVDKAKNEVVVLDKSHMV